MYNFVYVMLIPSDFYKLKCLYCMIRRQYIIPNTHRYICIFVLIFMFGLFFNIGFGIIFSLINLLHCLLITYFFKYLCLSSWQLHGCVGLTVLTLEWTLIYTYAVTCGLSRILQQTGMLGFCKGTITCNMSTELLISKYPTYKPFCSLALLVW